MQPFALTRTNYNPENFFPRINQEYREYVRRGLALDDMRDEDKFSMSDYLELGSQDEPFDDFTKLNFTPKVPPAKGGEHFKFPSIFSSHGVNHLIRGVTRGVDEDYNNDCEFVNVGLDECFEGKTLVLFFCASVPVKWCENSARYLCQLSIISSELLVSHPDFEMVFVPNMRKVGDDSGYYGHYDLEHFLTAFPNRLAVPCSSQSACDFICQKVGFRGDFSALLVSANHEVLVAGANYYIFSFGSAGFPFTSERISLLKNELLSRMSLAGLLGLHPKSHLTKFGSHSETISVEQLSKKVVGLYLFHRGDKLRVFNQVYEQCRDSDEVDGIEPRFEIVLVFFPPLTSIHPLVFEYEASAVLNELQRGRSWWALPYDNSTCLRLWRLTEELRRDAMIVVDPATGSVDPYGGEILASFGAHAYPFTRESIVEAYVEKAEQVTLNSLLSSESVDYVVGPDGQRVPLTELHGKNVVLCVDRAQPSDHTCEFLSWWCEEIALHHSESDFKVVYVLCKDSDSDSDSDLDSDDPVIGRRFEGTEWLEYPCNREHSVYLQSHEAFFRAVVENRLVTGLRPPSVVAFGRDGRIQLLNARYHVSLHGYDVDPFLPQYRNLRSHVINAMKSYLDFMWGYQ